MKCLSLKVSGLATAIAFLYSPITLATNGMNLEGYGPIATATGGASMAYDNGTAAVMNNPSTLGLMEQKNRLDIAVGMLGPDVSAAVTTPGGVISADSSGTSYYMPAFGWAHKAEKMTYGFAVFAQGGMGTEYGDNSWLADPSNGANTNLESGLVNRSEVGVGRVILPLVFELDKNVFIGGSVDFVWAGMDLQMAMSEAQFQNLANPQAQTIGTASGTMVDGFGQMYAPFGGAGINKVHHVYIDFSNDSDFMGEAFGTGVAGKLGITMKLSPKLTIGASYHSKTRLSDLETDNASLQMALNADPGMISTPTDPSDDGNVVDMAMDVTGKVIIRDFEWPSVMGFGAAFQATDKLLLAADFKRINWADVMEQFSMSFEADNVATNGPFAGAKMDMALIQEWKDQTVIAMGGAYKATDKLTLRLGYNHASNPIPDAYLNPLFPAITESHVTGGMGYSFGASDINFSISKALEIETSNPGNGSTMPKVTISHSQLSWQLMYSYLF